jgi:outer membrane protein TolC
MTKRTRRYLAPSQLRAATFGHSSFVIRYSVLAALFLALGCEQYHPLPLDQATVDNPLAAPDAKTLREKISNLKNPLLKPLNFEPQRGLTADEAAVLAVVLNPSLRAQRDARGLSQAAVLQAGLLPNPQLTGDYAWNTGGTAFGNINPYGFGINYDINALISHAARLHSAEYSAQSVDLDIAWQEWQTAEAAKVAVFDLISLRAQQNVLKDVAQRLADNLNVIQKAADLRLKTAIDLAAAETASRDARAAVLQTDRDEKKQELLLNRIMGFPPHTPVGLRQNQPLATGFTAPQESALLNNLHHRRLDLLALQQAYQSQEQTLVAATLDQFPRINLGLTRQTDNTSVRSIGLGVTIDIPLFDHNQGSIASEKATRQKLFDEYTARLFDARADIAQALTDITALNEQIKDAQAALPSLRQLVETYKLAVDHGSADVLSYYTAWNNLAQKNLDLLKLQQQLAETRIALELAAGEYFPDPAQPASSPASQPTTLPGAQP